MITRSEVQAHVECLSKGSKEMRDKLGSSVRCDMIQNVMLQEHMKDKQFRQLGVRVPPLFSLVLSHVRLSAYVISASIGYRSSRV